MDNDSQFSFPELEGTATVEMIVDGEIISIEVNGDDAPVTASNFVDLVERGFYDGLMFHRVEEGFVAQAGDPEGRDPEVPPEELGAGGFIDPETGEERNIPLEIKPEGAEEPIYSETFEEAEITVQPELRHTKGAIAMARTSDPDTASSQFYFTLDEVLQLDGSYAVFGNVTQGMDVVDEIEIGDRIDYAVIVEGDIPRSSSLISDPQKLNQLVNNSNKAKVSFVVDLFDDDEEDSEEDSGEEALENSDEELLSEEQTGEVAEGEGDEIVEDSVEVAEGEGDETLEDSGEEAEGEGDEIVEDSGEVAEGEGGETVEDSGEESTLPVPEESELQRQSAQESPTEDTEEEDSDTASGTEEEPEAEDSETASGTEEEPEAEDSETASGTEEEPEAEDSETAAGTEEEPEAEDSETASGTEEEPEAEDSETASGTEEEPEAEDSETASGTEEEPEAEDSDNIADDTDNTINMESMESSSGAMMGLGGDDEIYGTEEDDVINGNEDNDTIFGLKGDDWLRGGKGDDSLIGGKGGDYLIGDLGSDTLTGGKGDDMFILRADTAEGVQDIANADLILDWEEGEGIAIVGEFDPAEDFSFELVGEDTVIKLAASDDILGVVQSTAIASVEENIFVVAPDDVALGIG